MRTKEEILQTLNALKPDFQARYKVKKIGLFGSFSRGEQRETSDIDLLVEFEDWADLFDLVALAQFLEDRIGRKVDLISVHAMRQEIREQVLKEAAML